MCTEGNTKEEKRKGLEEGEDSKEETVAKREGGNRSSCQMTLNPDPCICCYTPQY